MKLKVAVIFGGKSAEHEVSLRSATNTLMLSTEPDLFLYSLESIKMVSGIISEALGSKWNFL